MIGRSATLSCFAWGLLACGPGPATTIDIGSLRATEDPALGERFTVEAELFGDGDVSAAKGELLQGGKTIAEFELGRAGASPRNRTFAASVERVRVLRASTYAPRGGTVDVSLTARFTLSQAAGAERSLTVRVGCGPDSAICAGACADLRSDPDHCGQCGHACVVSLSTGDYKGRCLDHRCNWPGVTVTVQAPCKDVCPSVELKGQRLACANACGYTRDGFVSAEPDVWYGAALYSLGPSIETRVIGRCDLVPEAYLNGDPLAPLSKILCCCGTP